MTAQDAVFSLTRLRDDPESVQSAMYQIMADISAPDDRTVVIRLSEPSAPFLATLAMFSAAILPEKAVTELGEEFGTKPVGAGAFRLKEWRRGEMIALESERALLGSGPAQARWGGMARGCRRQHPDPQGPGG